MQQFTKPCPICDNSLRNDTVYLDTWNHSLFKNRSISICVKCGFGQIYPKINGSDLNDYYENVYRSKNSPMQIDYKSCHLNINSFDHRSISQLLLGSQFLSHKNKYRFLDIGAGNGYSFVSARNILDNVDLFAIESNNDAKTFYIKFIKDITICEDLTEIKDEIDVVLMSHSLEHFDIVDIKGLFQDIYDVLGDNGLVIIEVPNADLRDSNILKRLNDTPHLSFFSLESLLRLVNKLDFELCFINTVGQLQTVSDSPENDTTGKMDFKNLKILLKASIKKVSKYLRLHEYLYKIYARLKNNSAFYNNNNFRYGGDRDCLRCVLRKKSVLKH